MPSVKMLGNMIELKNPTAMIDTIATCPKVVENRVEMPSQLGAMPIDVQHLCLPDAGYAQLIPRSIWN
jgi:hypothetical protein